MSNLIVEKTVIERFEELKQNLRMNDSDRKSFYENQNDADRVILIAAGKMDGLITTEMVEDLLKNAFISYSNYHFLTYVPREVITLDLAKLAVSSFYPCFECLPSDFQNMFEVQKICVEHSGHNWKYLISNDILLEETIEFALKIDGLNLGSIISKERITREFCEIAVQNRATALRFVPNKFKTYEMCKNAVIKDPKSLKYVPVQILTQEFVDEITMAGVKIPAQVSRYVKICLETNAKKENIENIVPTIQTASGTVVPEDVQNIEISSLRELFTLQVINLLGKYSIFTLGDLIRVVDNPKLCVEYFGKSNYYAEVVYTTKLLKCKYLDEDPIIDINDEQDVSSDFFKLLGLRLSAALVRHYCWYTHISIKDFFVLMKESGVERKLMKIRNLGTHTIVSVVERAKIILDYYEKHPENLLSHQSTEEPIQAHEESTENYDDIVKEYERLKAEREQLDNQIAIILCKIKEMEKKQGKGKLVKGK